MYLAVVIASLLTITMWVPYLAAAAGGAVMSCLQTFALQFILSLILYSVIANIYVWPRLNPFVDAIRGRANLVAHSERVRKHWPEQEARLGGIR